MVGPRKVNCPPTDLTDLSLRATVVIPSDLLRHQVEEVLGWIGGRLTLVQSLQQALGPSHRHAICLVESHVLLARDAGDPILKDLHDPRRPPFVVLLRPTEAHSLSTVVPPGVPCIVPRELERLPKILLRIHTEAWKSRVIAAIRGAQHLPLALRQAGLAVVSMQMPADPGGEHFLRSVSSIAGAIGVSREHLSRLSNARGINFRRLADSWCSLLALTEVVVSDSTLTNIAMRLGYSWQSGLVNLFRRQLLCSPTEALRTPLPVHLDRWVNTELRRLVEPGLGGRAAHLVRQGHES